MKTKTTNVDVLVPAYLVLSLAKHKKSAAAWRKDAKTADTAYLGALYAAVAVVVAAKGAAS